jgi:geranylgeranyl pyrophosphate synthase
MSSYVDRAREIALTLPEGAPRQALMALADYVLARTG